MLVVHSNVATMTATKYLSGKLGEAEGIQFMPLCETILKHTSTKTYRVLEHNPQTQTQTYTILVKFMSLGSRFPQRPSTWKVSRGVVSHT